MSLNRKSMACLLLIKGCRKIESEGVNKWWKWGLYEIKIYLWKSYK